MYLCPCDFVYAMCIPVPSEAAGYLIPWVVVIVHHMILGAKPGSSERTGSALNFPPSFQPRLFPVLGTEPGSELGK